MEPLDEEKEKRLTTKAVYDWHLVQQAVGGDQQAFAELMSRYKESVYFMMMKMCGNKDDAEDLAIEAFGRAFKKLAQYSPDYAFSTWLFKIASNNAIDFIRKKKQKYAVSLDAKSADNGDGTDHAANLKSGTLDPEETFIKKQKVENIRLLVDNLKPKYKEMIELFYFKELSHEEISQKLNLPVGTIKAQLYRAREVLYNALKGSKG